MKEEVILVDLHDNEIGSMEKMMAHQKGLLHRAFSVFVFNKKNELLLQKRASSKYHSGGLWTNTCCSHPRPGENNKDAAKRRLLEEMGLEVELQYKTAFTYRTEFDNGLIEHEFDHVFTGISESAPKINLSEVEDYKWETLADLKENTKRFPEKYTSWFKIAVEKLF